MKKLVQILKALGSEKRLTIIRAIKKNGEITVIDLSRETGIHYKTLADHLQILARAGLIRRGRHGRLVINNLEKYAGNIIAAVESYERRK